jgi:hypothetical protein
MAQQIITQGKFTGLFAGWGEARIIATRLNEKHEMMVVADTDPAYLKSHKQQSPVSHVERTEKKMSTLFSVSLAGSDLMGSCLYTAGVCTVNSGRVRPIKLR